MPVMAPTTVPRLTLSNGEQEERVVPASSWRCFPNTFWTPLWGFFEATYDDYGRVKLVDSAQARRRLVSMLTSLVGKEVSTNAALRQKEPASLSDFLKAKAPTVSALIAKMKESDNPGQARAERLASSFDYTRLLTKGALKGKKVWTELCATWEYLWDEAWEAQLYASRRHVRIRTDRRGPEQFEQETVFAPVQFALIHQAAADYLIGWLEKQKGKSGSLERRALFERAVKASGTLTAMRKSVAVSKSRKARKAGSDERASEYLMAWLEFSPVIEGLGKFEIVDYYEENNDLKPVMAAYADGVITEDEFFEVVLPMLNTRYIMDGLESMNLRITPVVSSSQDYDNTLGQAYAKFIRATSASVTKQRAAFAEEDDE